MLHPLVPPVTDWFSVAGRPLPWRAAGCSPWGVLVSEVMLQQTPVARVEPRWRAWQERWPLPADLASASPADVLRAWGGLGYPRRALRLQECAVVLVREHDGAVPADEEALLGLPGVGTYTAAAVLAFAFGRRSVVLDTNVRRVLARALDGIARPPAHLGAAELRRAGAVVPDDDAQAAEWNAGVMELGALVCTARAPRCAECPLADRCAWLAAGSPPDAHSSSRRRQAWAGTDRQARGRVMALLREAAGDVSAEAVAAAWPDEEQRRRVLAGLVADGLAETTHGPGTATDEAVRAPAAGVVGYRLPAVRSTAGGASASRPSSTEADP
ncbi:A/G-specific adenine glycosylase [Actinotalea sp.]|uniref:A/G-specific adenine glycosylase n=1 Tax=Actinotalea sp. TaxID=1872145 RepID=UPI0035660093